MEKMLKKSTQDRISALPDSLLLHILSCLHDMKEVQKTSVLSKRWQYIWTSVPNLTFRQSRHGKEKSAMFVAWVHRTLLCCQDSSIEKFHIKFHYYACFDPDIDSWARFASKKRVRDLNLDLDDSGSYSLPLSICCNSFLMNLSIQGCTLVPERSLSWASLKSLSLVFADLNEDTITKILVGSPLLEYLKVENCSGFEYLYINSESLKELVIEFGFLFDMRLLEISSPNLLSLHILGDYYFLQIRLISVSYMLKAELNFSTDDSRNAIELLESLHHVPELELGHWFIQALAPSLLEGKTLSSPLEALTCLKVNAFIDKQVAATIICLLKYTPNLEKLFIKRPLHETVAECSRSKRVEEYWESGRMIEKFSVPHLKTVKFHGFKKLVDAGEVTLTFVQVLLENAGNLECIVP